MAERAPSRTPAGPAPTTAARGPRAARACAEGGFRVVLKVLPGLTPRQEQAFEQEMNLYFQDRELLSEGTQLVMAVRSDTRELTVTDQVDMVAWLMRAAPVASVQVVRQGPEGVGDRAVREGAGAGVNPGVVSFRASRCDLAVLPLMQLYQMGRIGAEVVVRVLAP